MLSTNDYAVVDVETTRLKNNEIPKTKFWGYADSVGYKRCHSTRKLFSLLQSLPQKTLLHHSNFDVIQLLIDGAKITILKSHDGRLIKCVWNEHSLQNTYSAFPVALGEIFKAFGYSKTDLGQLAKRNRDDCVLGLECFLKLDKIFFDLVGVSPLAKGTIAGTGFASAEIVAGKMPKDLRFLAAYRGGRVEAFDLRCYCKNNWEYARGFSKMNQYDRIGTDAKNFDISSSYPRSFLEAPKESWLYKLRVKTKDWFCPLFDANRIDTLLFPNGEFTSFVYSDVWEKYLEPNCEHTTIKILSKAKINFEWLNELKPLVEKIYELKNRSDGGIRLCCKLLLNSLYGRIGLKGESERARVLPYCPDGDDISCFYIGRKRWLAFDKITRETRSNFPFAAYITDNARGRLYEAFVRNEAYYGDTDSIFSSAKRRFAGTIGVRCGNWQEKCQAGFQAYNVKDYRHGKTEIRKGGEHFFKWTLKQFGQGKSVESVRRTRRSSLAKRMILPNGETYPITVK